MTLDHIVPKCRGGPWKLGNVTILCQPCNGRKGSEMGWAVESLLQEESRAKPSQRWTYLSKATNGL